MSTARTVTMGDKPYSLSGAELQVGSPAPDFKLVATNMQPRSLSNYKGKVCIISAVPSIDTGVCDTETRRFNEIAAGLDENVAILTVSVDLPFAQRRWCGAAGVDKVEMLSDHMDVSFGNSYGVLIADLRILARCVFVVDQQGIVRYVQLVPVVGQEPDYQAVIAAAKALL